MSEGDTNTTPDTFPDDTASQQENPNNGDNLGKSVQPKVTTTAEVTHPRVQSQTQETTPSTFPDNTAQVEVNPKAETVNPNNSGKTFTSVPTNELAHTGNNIEPFAALGVGAALTGAAIVRAARNVVGRNDK